MAEKPEFYVLNKNGVVMFEYYNPDRYDKHGREKSYDTTRLILGEKLDVPDAEVKGKTYKAKVSWYGRGDAGNLVNEEDETRRNQYTDIVVDIEKDLLEINKQGYSEVLMNDVLDKSRVLEKYIMANVDGTARYHSGNYVGGYAYVPSRGEIRQEFDVKIGQAVYDSDDWRKLMVKYTKELDERNYENPDFLKLAIESAKREVEEAQAKLDKLMKKKREMEER